MQPTDLPEPARTHFDELNRYVDLLAKEGITWGLIGPNDADRDRLWNRHILNSLALEPLLSHAASVVDVGSGAGLPGIPLALVRPDMRMTLQEPLLRRVNFLKLAVAGLDLVNRVEIARRRAEDEQHTYDVVLARAVAPLSRLVGWCWHLVNPGGQIIALKGKSVYDEVDEAVDVLRKLRVTAKVMKLPVPGINESTWAVVVSAQ